MIIVIGAIAVTAVVIAAFFVLVSGVFSTPSTTGTPVVYLPAGVTPLTSPSGEYSSNGTIVLFKTSMGNITIQMRDDKPITTTNFVKLVKSGLYDGTIFHRVIAGFMIQGGAISSSNVSTIIDEIGNDNVNSNGTIAMANTGQPNSAISQFFINVADNGNQSSTFDSSYTVFGQVIGGMNVVMNISNVPVTANPQGEQSLPTQTIKLLHAYIVTH